MKLIYRIYKGATARGDGGEEVLKAPNELFPVELGNLFDSPQSFFSSSG
jgi:hypothetical protein